MCNICVTDISVRTSLGERRQNLVICRPWGRGHWEYHWEKTEMLNKVQACITCRPRCARLISIYEKNKHSQKSCHLSLSWSHSEGSCLESLTGVFLCCHLGLWGPQTLNSSSCSGYFLSIVTWFGYHLFTGRPLNSSKVPPRTVTISHVPMPASIW